MRESNIDVLMDSRDFQQVHALLTLKFCSEEFAPRINILVAGNPKRQSNIYEY